MEENKAMGFPLCFREHGGIQWVILENDQGTILPVNQQQSDGGHAQPAWVENVDLDIRHVVAQHVVMASSMVAHTNIW